MSKILIISSFQEHTPPNGYGGVERYVHWISNNLSIKGEDVCVIRKKGSIGGVYRSYDVESIVSIDFQSFLLKFNPDIVHLHIKNENIIKCVIELNIPILITIHSNMRHGSSWIPILGTQDKRIHFSCLSKNQKQRIEDIVKESGIKLKNYIKITGYGIDFNQYKYQKNQEKKFFYYMGVISRYKGVLNIVKSFIDLQNKHLNIVGPCNNHIEIEYFNEIISVVDSHDNIDYLGETKNEQDKISLISRASGLIVATGYDKMESDCYEAFGLNMLEANALGVPIIGYDKGNVSDFVKDGINGYKFKNIDQLGVLINKIESVDLSVSCLREAKKYDINLVTDKLLNLYRVIISDNIL